MDLQAFKNFAAVLGLLQDYLIEVAANEDRLRAFGLGKALHLEGATDALNVLYTFDERFTDFRRRIERYGPWYAKELAQIEPGQLTDQVALVSLRLRMSEKKRPPASFAAALVMGIVAKSKVFAEQTVPLERTIVQIERLRGLALSLQTDLEERQRADTELFKPSNVATDRVVQLIDVAVTNVQLVEGLGESQMQCLVAYLKEARAEAQQSNPSWSKVIGALVVVAALVSGVSDSPGAIKAVRDVIDYIVGASVNMPLQPVLPRPGALPPVPS